MSACLGVVAFRCRMRRSTGQTLARLHCSFLRNQWRIRILRSRFDQKFVFQAANRRKIAEICGAENHDGRVPTKRNNVFKNAPNLMVDSSKARLKRGEQRGVGVFLQIDNQPSSSPRKSENRQKVKRRILWHVITRSKIIEIFWFKACWKEKRMWNSVELGISF
jgi:hypothetical protein